MDQQPLVCPSHTTQYLGALVVGVLIGAGASLIFFKSSSTESYQAGFNAAKKLVTESSMGAMLTAPAIEDVRAIAGTVTKVEGNTITVKTQSMNPFEDKALALRTITVASTTKIIKIEQKDQKTFQAEMDAFTKSMAGTKKASAAAPSAIIPVPPMPPTPFKEVTVTIANIAVGDSLSVTAEENIKDKTTFTASQINVQAAVAPLAMASTTIPVVPPAPLK